jgi:hypothetical protein
MNAKNELEKRAAEYVRRHSRILGKELGYGVHGIVLLTKSQRGKKSAAAQSAIKIHEHEADYRRERDIYLRLKEQGVSTIRGCHVPILLGFDNNLWIIEMTVVSRPFLLDFAGAYLDKAPEFSEEVMADWLAEKREQFGDRWAEVAAILRALEGLGIHYIDVSPKNISLPE